MTERTILTGCINGPVVISGSGGFIGSNLSKMIESSGVEVRRLVRRKAMAHNEYCWNSDRGEVDQSAFDGASVLVHLAGSPISRRWTRSARKLIMDSRVRCSEQLVASACKSASIQTIVSASAIGYYGCSIDAPIATETTGRGQGFLADVCTAWEEAAKNVFCQQDVRRLILARIGVVLDPESGALNELIRNIHRFKNALYVGSGSQWMSWISLRDCLAAITHCIRDESVDGPVNIVAPTPALHRDITTSLAEISRCPCHKVPGPFVSALFGQFGREVLLGGRRVAPIRLAETGFTFEDKSHEILFRRFKHEIQTP